jgi:hypothetical protein
LWLFVTCLKSDLLALIKKKPILFVCRSLPGCQNPSLLLFFWRGFCDLEHWLQGIAYWVQPVPRTVVVFHDHQITTHDFANQCSLPGPHRYHSVIFSIGCFQKKLSRNCVSREAVVEIEHAALLDQY